MTAQAQRRASADAGGAVRHFLDIDRLAPDVLRTILDQAGDLKRAGRDGLRPLAGRTLAMIFEKPSTRTRVSFEVAMHQLGGHVVLLDPSQSQLGRGETVADTARVLSRYVDAIMIRTDQPDRLDELATHAAVPVINGLTDDSHPCQLMADVLTIEERRGPIAGQTVTWVGDGNNVANSWIHGAVAFGYALRLSCPDQLQPSLERIDEARRGGARIELDVDPQRAVGGADVVVTDTWVSMGDKDSANRHNLLQPYQVNARLMAQAKPDALFMHCLPAHRGEEVTGEVIDGPQSVVWDEAENRLHAQKAILAWCVTGLSGDGDA